MASLSSISDGPQYTFWNSQSRTSVDYIIGCLQASQFINSCFTHDVSPLNTSDHLPLFIVLDISVVTNKPNHTSENQKIDWIKARKTNRLYVYQEQVASLVHPLLGNMYDSVEHLDNEIIYVSKQLVQAACHTLPTLSFTTKKKKWFKDQELSCLAALKKAAWDKWSSSGRPQVGPLKDEKIKCRREFRRRLNICAAAAERAHIQDQKFKRNSTNCFKTSRITSHGSTLRVSGSITSDPSTILNAWENHFKEISSRSTEYHSPLLLKAKQQMTHLLYNSRGNEDFVLDTPFTTEEIDHVLHNLKRGKAPGHDQVQPEHLKYGGTALSIWIKQVANAIIELESIPRSLKLGIVTLLYKGGGKDPFDTKSYRGITLSPVLAKVMESLILGQLYNVLAEDVLPHAIQMAYQKNISLC